MNRQRTYIILLMMLFSLCGVKAQRINTSIHPETGGITSITIEGDTMPHYWSCITADCFAYYSLCTGDESYMQRSQTILRGNLSLFTEDGRGYCAWLYPTRVNGRQAAFPDPMSNDQDFALMYYLKWNK